VNGYAQTRAAALGCRIESAWWGCRWATAGWSSLLDDNGRAGLVGRGTPQTGKRPASTNRGSKVVRRGASNTRNRGGPPDPPPNPAFLGVSPRSSGATGSAAAGVGGWRAGRKLQRPGWCPRPAKPRAMRPRADVCVERPLAERAGPYSTLSAPCVLCRGPSPPLGDRNNPSAEPSPRPQAGDDPTLDSGHGGTRLEDESANASARPAHGLRPRGVNPSVRAAASPNRHSIVVRMSSALSA
jgi:hypothetical protein